MGKFTISMAIFNSYVKLPEGNPGEELIVGTFPLHDTYQVDGAINGWVSTRPAGPWRLFPSWEGHLFPGDESSGKSGTVEVVVPQSRFFLETQRWNSDGTYGFKPDLLNRDGNHLHDSQVKKASKYPMIGSLIHWPMDQIFSSPGSQDFDPPCNFWKWQRWPSALFGHKNGCQQKKKKSPWDLHILYIN